MKELKAEDFLSENRQLKVTHANGIKSDLGKCLHYFTRCELGSILFSFILFALRWIP